MAERTLCEGEVRVTMDGGGERTLIVVGDGGTTRFWADTAEMEGILKGGTAHLSAHGASCVFEIEGERGSLEYRLEGEERKRCTFSMGELASILAWVRSLPPPTEAAPSPATGGG